MKPINHLQELSRIPENKEFECMTLLEKVMFLYKRLTRKQNNLISGKNIMTINGTDILQSGNLEIESGTAGVLYINTTGDDGNLTPEDIEKLNTENGNVVIINDNEYYHKMYENSVYYAFVNVDTITTTHISYKAIYINKDRNTFNKEESTELINYNDVINKPSLNGVVLSGNVYSSELGISYDDLTDKPTIPTKTSELINDVPFANQTDINLLIDQIPNGTATGTNINIQDSSNMKLNSLSIDGKTTQDGTPTPDDPVDIENITGNVKVTVCGKNLYSKDGTRFESTATTVNWCYDNGKGGAFGANICDKAIANPFILDPGVYNIRVFNLDDNILNLNICWNGETSEGVFRPTESGATFTVDVRRKYVIRYRVTNPSLGIGNTKIMISKGNSPSDYEPYKEQVVNIPLGDNELCKIGDVADTLTIDKGQVKLVKRIGKYYADPTYPYIIRTDVTTSGGTCFRCSSFDYNLLKTIGLGYSSHFIYSSGNPLGGFRYIKTQNYGIQFIISNQIAETVEELKTWLNNNELYFYYITNETEITLPNITLPSTYKHITNIFNDKGTNMNVSYKKDLETTINNLNNAIISLGNNV